MVGARQLVRQGGGSGSPFYGAQPLQPTRTRAPTGERLPIVTSHQPTITLLPMGEGAAQRRMKADQPGVAALTRPSARPHMWGSPRSQGERDTITLLPMGEGAAQRRMRANQPGVAALTRPSARPHMWGSPRSQWERDTITLLPMGEGAAKRRMRADPVRRYSLGLQGEPGQFPPSSGQPLPVRDA